MDYQTKPMPGKVAGHHFDKGKEHVCQGSKVNKMEANECDPIFDEPDDD